MGYGPVAQTEQDARSESSPSNSPQHPSNFRPVSTHFVTLGSLSFEAEHAKSESRLDSMLRSVASTGTSYDVVEHDDYSDQPTPKRPVPKPVQTGQPASAPELTRMRTASVGESVQMKHPTPDLQSLQGAYVKNIERLEKSADELSLSSSREEKRVEQFVPLQPPSPRNFSFVGHPSRQVSTTSLSNSVVDVNAEPMPPVDRHNPVARPTQDLLSPGWPLIQPDIAITSAPHSAAPSQPHVQTQRQVSDASNLRPATAVSSNTYRQANTLFADFDGVHLKYPPSIREDQKRQSKLSPPMGVQHRPDGMVFYPAPVPMMLNLPQKLSKMPSPAERERRRLQALSAVPTEMRKSAAWLNDEGQLQPEDKRVSRNLAAHLRASAFFEHPTISPIIDNKGASAVETLDSILDASAQAPVSAFTDHPFAGQLGGDVYAAERKRGDKKKRRNSLGNMLRTTSGLGLSGEPNDNGFRLTKRKSQLTLGEGEGSNRESKAFLGSEAGDYPDWPGGIVLKKNEDAEKAKAEKKEGDEGGEAAGEGEGEDGEEEEEESSDDEVAYAGPPTTLLAELQMRKTQMKSRTRTAARAYPDGMHSTLLELDAVAQIEAKSRRKKHITLAWEDPDLEQDAEHDDDGDVPLGMLLGQKPEAGVNRPMGLMEQREMEENEPLSRRRARLRGDDLVQPPPFLQRASTMHTLDLPSFDKPVEEREGESLTQRIQRLKADRKSSGVAAEFSEEVSGQLGLENIAPAEEETLGQRRKRLREDALRKSRQPSGLGPGIKARSSMADILNQHPAAGGRQSSYEYANAYGQQPMYGGYQDNRFSYMPAQTFTMPGNMAYPSFNPNMGSGMGMPMSGMGMGMANPMNAMNTVNPMSGMSPMGGFNYGSMYAPAMGTGLGMGMGMQSGGWAGAQYAQEAGLTGPLDAKQRDLIDRWRQGIGPESH